MTGSIKVVGGESVAFDTEVPESLEVAREVYARETAERQGMAFDATSRERITGSYDPATQSEVIITRQFAGG